MWISRGRYLQDKKDIYSEISRLRSLLEEKIKGETTYYDGYVKEAIINGSVMYETCVPKKICSYQMAIYHILKHLGIKLDIVPVQDAYSKVVKITKEKKK